jgi:hypothetical protein
MKENDVCRTCSTHREMRNVFIIVRKIKVKVQFGRPKHRGKLLYQLNENQFIRRTLYMNNSIWTGSTKFGFSYDYSRGIKPMASGPDAAHSIS